MNPRTKLLAAALALVAAAPTASAQSPAASFGRRPMHRFSAPTFTTPYLAHRRPMPVSRMWIPGHRQRVQRRVWVEGQYERQWVPPGFETRLDQHGRPLRVLVREGRWTVAREPGHFKARWVEVWVDGHWKTAR